MAIAANFFQVTDAQNELLKQRQAALATIALASPTDQGADLSEWCGTVFDQASEGSCTACTTRDIIYWKENKYGWKVIIVPNVQSIYYWARKIFGDLSTDSGSNVHDAFQGAVEFGIIPESAELYTNADIFTEPPMQFLAFKATVVNDYQPNTTNIRSLLESGEAVGIAVDVHDTLMGTPIQYNGMSIIDAGVLQPGLGHAIAIFAYKPDPKYKFLYKFQNSWGENWADKGFAWFTEEYLVKALREVSTLDIPHEAPVPNPNPVPTPAPTPDPTPKPKPEPIPNPPNPGPHPSTLMYELTVGPMSLDIEAKVMAFCSSIHVGAVRYLQKGAEYTMRIGPVSDLDSHRVIDVCTQNHVGVVRHVMN